MRGTEDGFSLIEAMVALVVLALAGVALVGTSEAHIRRIAGLESRAVATFVAENRAAELAVGAVRPDAAETIRMMGGVWRVDHEIGETDDPALARVTIRVRSEADDRAHARYIAFLDREGAR